MSDTEPITTRPAPLPRGGRFVVVTDDGGGMGRLVADLFRANGEALVATGRSEVPPGDAWMMTLAADIIREQV